jgi:hypothetical protein
VNAGLNPVRLASSPPPAPDPARFLLPGESALGPAVRVENNSSEEFVPVAAPAGTTHWLVFNAACEPLGIFPIATGERGPEMYVKNGEPLFVAPMRGRARTDLSDVRPFSVFANDKTVSLRLGGADSDGAPFRCRISWKPWGDKNFTPFPRDVEVEPSAGGFVSFPANWRAPGEYRFEIFAADDLAHQKPLALKELSSYGRLQDRLPEFRAAARRYAPVLSLPAGEMQAPVSLAGVRRGLSPDEQVRFTTPSGRVITTRGADVDRLGYWGAGTIDVDFKKTGLRANPAPASAAELSYTLVPDPSDENLLHVSYNCNYRFDAKEGTRANPGKTAHAFDGEGVIVTLERRDGQWQPRSVTYRHHIPKQTMALVDPNGKQVESWSHGAVTVPWAAVVKTAHGNPVVAVSSAHASYPVLADGRGGFQVVAHDGINIRALTSVEAAGGGPTLAPPGSAADHGSNYRLSEARLGAPTTRVAGGLEDKSATLRLFGTLPVGEFTLQKPPTEILELLRGAKTLDAHAIPAEYYRRTRELAAAVHSPGE